MMKIDIQPTVSTDIPALQVVLDETGLFPSEMLPDMLAGFLGDTPEGIWLTCHLREEAVGLCYAAPELLTDGTWNMLALAVLPAHQGSGCGGALASHLESLLRDRRQRVLIVDTSGSEDFRPDAQILQKNRLHGGSANSRFSGRRAMTRSPFGRV